MRTDFVSFEALQVHWLERGLKLRPPVSNLMLSLFNLELYEIKITKSNYYSYIVIMVRNMMMSDMWNMVMDQRGVMNERNMVVNGDQMMWPIVSVMFLVRYSCMMMMMQQRVNSLARCHQ